jgi:hypothetical protein
MFRIISIALTLAIAGYMFYAMNAQNKAIDALPAVQEQKKVLQGEGVDASDKKALQDYNLRQAKDIQEYQNQINQMPDDR